MSLSTEIKRFGRAFWANLKGKEPNLIPLSGLTLEQADRELAGRLMKANSSEWKENSILDFEESLATYTGHQKTFSFSEGRVALSAILQALQLNKDEEVLVCGFTCIAVSNSVVFHGGKPIYYDIELNTYGPDLEDVKRKFEAHTNVKGIILQHTFGMIGDHVAELVKWAKSKGIWVIEDAAHALGASKDGLQAGHWGDAVFYSFERSKCISTFQGGAAASKDAKISRRLEEIQLATPFPSEERIRHLLRQFIFTYETQRDNARWVKRLPVTYLASKEYIPGNKAEELRQQRPDIYMLRLAAPLAQMGLNQIANLNHYNAIRRDKALEWAFWADSRGLQRPRISTNDQPAFLRYPILVSPEEKQDLSWAIDLGIEVGIWYKSHLHPTGIQVNNCPNAEIAIARCVNLPTNLAYKS